MCLWKVLELQIKILLWTGLRASQQQGTGDAVKAEMVSQVGEFGSCNEPNLAQAVCVGGICRSKGVQHDLGIFE